MRIKTLFSSIILALTIGFVSCDDDVETVGGSIRPEKDDIFLGVDTVTMTAKTVSLNDSVYFRSSQTILGEYTDPLFGNMQSGYFTQFDCPGESKDVFKDKVVAIDSVEMRILTSKPFIGEDRLVGLSAYMLNNQLDGNYYTNIKPENYCDLSKPIGSGSYVYKDALITDPKNPTYRNLVVKIDSLVGKQFVQEWKNNPSTFEKQAVFNQFFPGIYLRKIYGDDHITPIHTSNLNIYYKYIGRNKDNTKDSIQTSAFTLSTSGSIVQMNSVKNDIPNSLLTENTGKTYLKTPAGLCTEITIPIAEIIKKVNKGKELSENKPRTINSATFKLKGYTVEEEKSGLNRPDFLLFINKDSLDQKFIEGGWKETNQASFLMRRSQTTNAGEKSNNDYQFSLVRNNIAKLVTFHLEKYAEETDVTKIPDLKYYVLPIGRIESQTGETDALFHLIAPTSAVLRTTEDDLKMSFIFSKYKER